MTQRLFKQASFFSNDGTGKAFWYDPENGLHWGDTHYMIFHNLGMPKGEKGVFGWVFPIGDDEDHPEEPDYYIDFGSDFGYGANQANRHLHREAERAVEEYIGYPEMMRAHYSGHSYETDDLDNAAADSLTGDFPYIEIPCDNCGIPVYHGEICGNCGTENLKAWTPLETFKGSVKRFEWQEDEAFERIVELDKRWSGVYTISRLSSWEDEFPEEFEDEEMPGGEMPEPSQEIDGWKVYEMSSGEYPTHDALYIDPEKKVLAVNYQGHHSPLFEEWPQLMRGGGYSSTAGHFRTEPSTTEPFPAGWGWHGREASPEEKDIIKQVLKSHYRVDKLKHLYK